MKVSLLQAFTVTAHARLTWEPILRRPCPVLRIDLIHNVFRSFPLYCKISPLGFQLGGSYSTPAHLTNSQTKVPKDSTAPIEKPKNSDIVELHGVGKGIIFCVAASSLFFLFYEDQNNNSSYFCNIPIPKNYNPNSPYTKYFHLCFLLPVASLPKAVGETFLVRLNEKTQIPLEILFFNYVRCYTLLKRLSTTVLSLSITLLVYPIIYSIAGISVPIILKQYGLVNKGFCFILTVCITTFVSGTVMNSFVSALIWVLPKCSAVLLHLPLRLKNEFGSGNKTT